MSLDKIRTIWGMIGTILVMIPISSLPAWVSVLFGTEATGYVFDAIGAIFALIQLLPFRTGENKPAALNAHDKAKPSYWLPWTPA